MIRRSVVKPVVHIWSQDSALAKGEGFPAVWQKFLDTGEHPPMVEGSTPTLFTLAPLSRHLWLRLENVRGLAGNNEIVAYALQSVQDYFDGNGTPIVLERATIDGVSRVVAKSLDTIYDPSLFAELADRVVEISRLHP